MDDTEEKEIGKGTEPNQNDANSDPFEPSIDEDEDQMERLSRPSSRGSRGSRRSRRNSGDDRRKVDRLYEEFDKRQKVLEDVIKELASKMTIIQRKHEDQREQMAEESASVKETLNTLISKMDTNVRPILTNRNEPSEGQNDLITLDRDFSPTRRVSRPASRTGSSRPPSRFHSEEDIGRNMGTGAVTKVLAHGTQMVLKQKTHRYQEAADNLRKCIEEASIEQRGRNDEKIIINQMQKEFDQKYEEQKMKMGDTLNLILNQTQGLVTDFGTGHLRFYGEITEASAKTMEGISKNLKDQGLTKISAPGDSFRQLIETVLEGYGNYAITEKQFKQLIVGACINSFKDTIKFELGGKDINKAIQDVVKRYGNVKTPKEKMRDFDDARLDWRNVRESLSQLLKLAREAFQKTMTSEEVEEKTKDKVMTSIPKTVRQKVRNLLVDRENLRKHDSNIQPLDFHEFSQIIIEQMSQHNPNEIKEKKQQEKAVKAIQAQQKKEEEAKSHATGANAVPLGPAPPGLLQTQLERNQTQIVAAIANMNERLNQMANNSTAPATATPAAKPQDPAPTIKKLFIGSPEFQAATQNFQKQGVPVESAANTKIMNNAKWRSRPSYQIKNVDDPNQRIPYVTENGLYVPSSEPIRFHPYLKIKSGKEIISDEMLDRMRYQCYRCGEAFCGANARNCLYFTPTLSSWEMCLSCRQGFHATISCKANKPITTAPKN